MAEMIRVVIVFLVDLGFLIAMRMSPGKNPPKSSATAITPLRKYQGRFSFVDVRALVLTTFPLISFVCAFEEDLSLET
jgi:hypothetical protein